MADEPWPFQLWEVVTGDEGAWFHITGRWENVDNGERRVDVQDATHTWGDRIGVEYAAERYESAGWTTKTKPAHERGFRVNGMLVGPSGVERRLGESCLSNTDCEECDESTEGAADIILSHEGQELAASWVQCRACGHVTEVLGDPVEWVVDLNAAEATP